MKKFDQQKGRYMDRELRILTESAAVRNSLKYFTHDVPGEVCDCADCFYQACANKAVEVYINRVVKDQNPLHWLFQTTFPKLIPMSKRSCHLDSDTVIGCASILANHKVI